MRRKIAAGNWKMNGTAAALADLGGIAGGAAPDGPEVLICPPATLLSRAAEAAAGTALQIGGQDCHAAAKGAHTGDIAADMLVDAGASHVILGHSERRTDHGETSEAVRAKTDAAVGAGLVAVVCIGETEAEYRAGDTLKVLGDQLSQSLPDGTTPETTVIAYEPVWAIGTGLTPTTDEIGAVHNFLRDQLVERFGQETGTGIRLLYGGSVKASNAAEIFAVADVDGALVGGASLRAADFVPIIEALAQA